MERVPTLFLKITVVLIALPIVALCLVGLPAFAVRAADSIPAYWLYPALAGLYASAVPYFAALYQAFRLLNLIDAKMAFSPVSVAAIRKIKRYAIAISALYTASTPFLYFLADADDAPGLLVLDLAIAFASIVIAVFAAVLEKLLQAAIAIKSEHDLTI
ncbi:MAG: DUF2975 domain-containing protein [Paenibacillaceae bacterium]|nr:DUF2975 domain-containing protein [Paenibacillaceae bacterium]